MPAVTRKAVGAVRGALARRVAKIEGPLAAHIEECNRTGADLTQVVTDEFVSNWKALWPYRKQRFFHELNQIRIGGVYSLATFDLKDLISVIKFWARLIAMFMLGIMVCRNSVLPPMAPDSPLLPGQDIVNPNWI